MRKIISKSQDIIRANLESGEELRLIVPSDLLSSDHTFVVTTRRLLIFESPPFKGACTKLKYVIRVTDSYHLTVDEVNRERYYIRLEGPDFTATMETSNGASASVLASAVEAMGK